MTREISILFATIILSFPVYPSSYTKDVWRALERGADVDVLFRVVDDEGVPVGGASCSGWLYQEGVKGLGSGYSGTTDTNGCFRVRGMCGEWFSLIVRKEGHYKSMIKTKYPTDTAAPAVVDGKWQPYGEMQTVVLKKIKDPWAGKTLSREECHRNIPAFGQWLSFDMELSDWLPPHGHGIHDDVLLRFEKKKTAKWNEFSFSMEACFTNNPSAGVYRKSFDTFSDLKTDYKADTTADYKPHYLFSIQSIPGKPVKCTRLEKNEYLVFRTRTRVDENGELIGAHYGKYCGVWRSDAKEMHLGDGCFNPNENDPNIEGDQALLYAIRNYREQK